ncbi:hypothetical protein B296_00050057, partial [Ensete ventricosum]
GCDGSDGSAATDVESTGCSAEFFPLLTAAILVDGGRGGRLVQIRRQLLRSAPVAVLKTGPATSTPAVVRSLARRSSAGRDGSGDLLLKDQERVAAMVEAEGGTRLGDDLELEDLTFCDREKESLEDKD